MTIQFAKKPSQRGTLGRKIRLSSNHYMIKINAQRYPVIHTYDVSIERSNQKSSFKRNEKRLIKNKDLLKYNKGHNINELIIFIDFFWLNQGKSSKAFTVNLMRIFLIKYSQT